MVFHLLSWVWIMTNFEGLQDLFTMFKVKHTPINIGLNLQVGVLLNQ